MFWKQVVVNYFLKVISEWAASPVVSDLAARWQHVSKKGTEANKSSLSHNTTCIKIALLIHSRCNIFFAFQMFDSPPRHLYILKWSLVSCSIKSLKYFNFKNVRVHKK